MKPAPNMNQARLVRSSHPVDSVFAWSSNFDLLVTLKRKTKQTRRQGITGKVQKGYSSTRADYLRVAYAKNCSGGEIISEEFAMRPYLTELRERVAAAVDYHEGYLRQITRRFCVSLSFIVRLLQRRRNAGTLAPKPHGGGPVPVLGPEDYRRLAALSSPGGLFSWTRRV
jgi:hypothetical protein